MAAGLRRALLVLGALGAFAAPGPLLAADAAPALPRGWSAPALEEALQFARSQNTTGLLIVQDGRVVVKRDWPVQGDAHFRLLTYGLAADGSLREDVESQQKSYISVLVAIASDRGLIDPKATMSHYLGDGWSKAPVEAERKITLENVLEMSSGLTTELTYDAPAGSKFVYNTQVYSRLRQVLEKVTGRPLNTITTEWLTRPLHMTDTEWRPRKTELDVNPVGLVTTPADTAKFGRMVLDGGRTPEGRRLVSQAAFAAMFRRDPTNDSYGRLWWLNGGAYTIWPGGRRSEGSMFPHAPADAVMALGALERLLYVSPNERLIVVRMGAEPPLGRGFGDAFWSRLRAATPKPPSESPLGAD